FGTHIDWNDTRHGKLWAYNLNYFDFLHQKDFAPGNGIALIDAYVSAQDTLRQGTEPYPISLRCINWIKFFSANSISNASFDKVLFTHCRMLTRHLEYHLMGNHLLENGLSLLHAAYYFRNEEFYSHANRIVTAELQ